MKKAAFSRLRGVLAGILLPLLTGGAAGIIAVVVMLAKGQAALSLRSCMCLLLLAAGWLGAFALSRGLTRVQQPEPEPQKQAPAPAPRREKSEEWKIAHSELKPLKAFGWPDSSGVPQDILMAGVIASYLCEHGYTMERTLIGGGGTEVSHTGSVAYDASYPSLEALLSRAQQDYLQADETARNEYGSWFTSLNYHWIRQTFRKPGALIETDHAARLTIRWEFEEGCEDMETVSGLIAYLTKER